MSIFNLKLREELDLCNDKDYYFRFTDLPPAIQEGQAVDIYLQGGIGPFTWTMISAGSAFTDATTTGKQNELTCTTLPTSGHLQFSVEDSCGTEITGELVPLDYDPGEGCTSGEPPPTLVLSGTDEPIVGSVYTASGGTAPYSFSFDSGTITTTSDTCTIASINSCGSTGVTRVGVISVTDDSPIMQTVSVDGRLAGGQWVVLSITYYASGGSDWSADCSYVGSTCCCDSWEGMAQYQEVKYTDGTSIDAFWINGGILRMEWVYDNANSTGSCSGCSYCGDSDQADQQKACASALYHDITTSTDGLYIYSGKTFSEFAFTYAGMRAIGEVLKKWVCP